MDIQKSNEYKFFHFDRENSILTHEICEENAGNEDLYIMAMSHFSTLIEKHSPKNIIVKVMQEPKNFHLVLKGFFDTCVVKSIVNTGVKKIAFCLPESEVLRRNIDNEITEPCRAKFFSDLEKATEWILSKN